MQNQSLNFSGNQSTSNLGGFSFGNSLGGNQNNANSNNLFNSNTSFNLTNQFPTTNQLSLGSNNNQPSNLLASGLGNNSQLSSLSQPNTLSTQSLIPNNSNSLLSNQILQPQQPSGLNTSFSFGSNPPTNTSNSLFSGFGNTQPSLGTNLSLGQTTQLNNTGIVNNFNSLNNLGLTTQTSNNLSGNNANFNSNSSNNSNVQQSIENKRPKNYDIDPNILNGLKQIRGHIDENLRFESLLKSNINSFEPKIHEMVSVLDTKSQSIKSLLVHDKKLCQSIKQQVNQTLRDCEFVPSTIIHSGHISSKSTDHIEIYHQNLMKLKKEELCQCLQLISVLQETINSHHHHHNSESTDHKVMVRTIDNLQKAIVHLSSKVYSIHESLKKMKQRIPKDILI